MGLKGGVYGSPVRGLWTVFTLWSLMGMAGLGLAIASTATPRNMGEIVVGRCEEYQRVVHPELFKENELKNCTDLWLKLRKAFANKGPCNVTVESYRDYVDAANHRIDTQDKVMYWSGPVYPMVVSYARLKSNQYLTIREILAAYVILNIENWCGQVAPPGLNHDECPAWGTCTHLAAHSFWTALSVNFAKQVKGTVHVMLNGSTGAAYDTTRIFAKSELKNLDAERTPVMHVHLVYGLNGPIKERCGEGTLVTLQQDVEKKGMKLKCSDDDRDLLYFQCVTDMGAERCRAIDRNGAHPEHPLGLTSVVLMMASLLTAVLYRQA